MTKTKVYYNSACPVCDAGIAYQRRKLGDSQAEIEWIDVHADNDAVAEVARNVGGVEKVVKVFSYMD